MNGTTSSHETALPCASLYRATTQVCRAPSSVTITSGLAAMGAGAGGGGGVLADCPQPASHTQIPIMAAGVVEPCRVCRNSDRAINPILPKPAKCLGTAHENAACDHHRSHRDCAVSVRADQSTSRRLERCSCSNGRAGVPDHHPITANYDEPAAEILPPRICRPIPAADRNSR
jgi:hypothetical protein